MHIYKKTAVSSEIATEAPKFNYKEERKRLETQIKKAQKLIEDCDKKIAELTKKRDALNESLVSGGGNNAASLAKDLHDTSATIEELEMKMLEAMEEQHGFENELKQLIG